MPDVAIKSNSTDETGHFNSQSQRLSSMENAKRVNQFVDPNLYRKPDFFVYVYSVADPRPRGKELVRELSPLIKRLIIPAVKPGERYTLVTKLPHPMQQADIDVNNGNQITHFHDARRVAMDIVNPENTTGDQDAVLRPEHSFAEGNDYGKLGVFFSLNHPPTDEEIAAAITRKENHYRTLLEQARVLETSDPKLLNAALTTSHHVAADYFGEEFSWHRAAKRPYACPNCGEPCKEGVAFHRSTDGILCVIDWKRTVAAGVKARKDVPEEARWWSEEEEKPSRRS